jgi:hypothetical protein
MNEAENKFFKDVSEISAGQEKQRKSIGEKKAFWKEQGLGEEEIRRRLKVIEETEKNNDLKLDFPQAPHR